MLSALLLGLQALGLAGLCPAAARAATPGTLSVETYRALNDNTDQPFSVYLPTGWSATGLYPCVLYLHGFGGRFATSIGSGQKSWADSKRWILAFADGRGSLNYDHIGEEDLLALRQTLLQDFGADPLRIYLQGFSMGGHGTYRLALRYPDLFAAASPAAGWTDQLQFYPQYYEQATEPRLPEYLDPARASLLRHAAALPQAENGLPVAWRVYYGRSDTVNPPQNATRMLQAWRALGHTQLLEVAHDGGHASEPAENAYPFFEGKAVVSAPRRVVYQTSRLRHDGAFWARIQGFTEREQPARILAEALPALQRLEVQTTNLEAFTLAPPAELLSPSGETALLVDGVEVTRLSAPATLQFQRQRDGEGFATGWTASRRAPSNAIRDGAAATRNSATGKTAQARETLRAPEARRRSALPAYGRAASPVRKQKGCEGPIGEATLAPFVVLYGTSGTAQQTAENLACAQLFCGQWNAMAVLRWSSQRPVPDGWWVPPYPFDSGAFVQPAQALQPYSEADAATLDLSGKNLILFGDPSSHARIARYRESGALPLDLRADGLGLAVADRVYQGSTVRYVFVAPRPEEPDRLVLISKGLLSSLPELNWSAFDLAKDLEQSPWLLPDYAIWDLDRTPGGIVNAQSTYRYLPERFLEAGFFRTDWRVDDQPPRVRARFSGTPDPADSTRYLSGGELVLEGCDEAGGSGLSTLEYRLGEGDWQPYVSPLSLLRQGSYSLACRARDRGLAWGYGPHPVTGRIRALQAFQNTGTPLELTIVIGAGTAPPNGFLLRRVVGRLSPASNQHGPGGRVGRGEWLELALELGSGVLPEGPAGHALALGIGNLQVGPFEANAQGVFYFGGGGEGGEGGAAPRTRGRLFRREGAWWMRLRVTQADLETALGIDPQQTDTTVVFDLLLSVDGAPLAPVSGSARLIRSAPGRPGFLRRVEGF